MQTRSGTGMNPPDRPAPKLSHASHQYGFVRAPPLFHRRIQWMHRFQNSIVSQPTERFG
jgi:hypothetical protein